jgi:crotonobetainyl-CoA:carnitine CoA-transferase CaiB-like acyl-CoA transferase
VLEFGHFVAGPFCGEVLGDLGADVVKVEPLAGEPLRHSGSASFVAANRGKRSVTLDIKHPDSREVIDAAVAWADVVTHNFRPGVGARLGIDAASLRGRKPELIVVETSAYGSEGPRSGLPGFDSLLQAVAGHFVQAGGEGSDPIGYRLSHVDHGTGMLGALGAVAALHRRRRTGRGASINVDLLSTAVFMLSELVRDANGKFQGLEPIDARRSGAHPAESLYEAADGWIAIAALDERATRGLSDAVGADQVASVPRKDWGAAERAAIATAIRERSVDANLALLRGASVWAEKCEEDGLTALAADPAMRRAGTAVAVDSPEYGALVHVGPGVSFDRRPDVPARQRTHLADLGEHTREFLHELGFSEQRIGELHAGEVVR